MFVLKKSHAYWWPCIAKVPADGGAFKEQEFQLLFETVDEKEAEEIIKDIKEAELKGDLSRGNDLLKHAVKNWKDVKDEDGGDTAFDAESFALALSFPWFRAAAYEGWMNAQNGRERARKN